MTTDWKRIQYVSSVGACTTDRIIGRKVSEASEHRSGIEVGIREERSASSTEARLKYFANLTEFTCGHGRLFWKPCRNCHRDKESAKQWWKRLLPRVKEVLNQQV
jgi:hypothetical protein